MRARDLSAFAGGMSRSMLNFGHPLLQACLRQRLEPPRHRRCRQPRAWLGGHPGLGQAHCTPYLARGHVHQHQAHRPLLQPTGLGRLLPAGQRQLLAGGLRAHPRALHLHLAAVKAQGPLGAAPAISRLVGRARMRGSGQRRRIFLQHLRQTRQAGDQAEALEARSDLVARFLNRCRQVGSAGQCQRGRDVLVMVLLSVGLNPPSLRLRESNATLHSAKFNIDRDIPGSSAGRRLRLNHLTECCVAVTR